MVILAPSGSTTAATVVPSSGWAQRLSARMREPSVGSQAAAGGRELAKRVLGRIRS
jgi:hypothetical protein